MFLGVARQSVRYTCELLSKNRNIHLSDSNYFKITLSDIYTDPHNWWIFKDTKTGACAEIDPELDTGRTAHETANEDMIIQAALFELVLPPVILSSTLIL